MHPARFLWMACMVWGSVSWAQTSRPATAPATMPATEAVAFQGGGPLLGQAEPIAAPPMRVRWTYHGNAARKTSYIASPIIAGNTVYIADQDGTLHAIDLLTGKARWTYTADTGFETTPLLLDGKLLLGDLGGIFHAVSAADGKKVWTIDVEGAVHASANAFGHAVLFGTDSADIFCLSSVDGKTLWKAKAGDRVNSAPAIGAGLAFFAGCDMQLRAIDLEKGEDKFTVELDSVAPGSAVLWKDRAIIGTDQGRVLCIDIKTRKRVWMYTRVENEMMVYATPAVGEGIVVVGARDRQIHGIDLKTGERRWVFATHGEVNAPPVISDGRVYIPSQDHKLYVLDLKTGNLIWQFNGGRGIDAGVAIGGGAVVVADFGGNVYCLEPGEEPAVAQVPESVAAKPASRKIYVVYSIIACLGVLFILTVLLQRRSTRA